MKVAIAAAGDSLEAMVEERLGRASFFVYAEDDGKEWHVQANPSAAAPGGAGVAVAQYLVDKGVEAIIAGNAGPNAIAVFKAAGIEVYVVHGKTVHEALKAWRAGKLEAVKEATVPSHFGQAPAPISSADNQNVAANQNAAEKTVVAVATEGTMVAQHFGRCAQYTLVTVVNGKEAERRIIHNPGHKPGFLPGFLGEKGAEVVITGGMGPRAVELFTEQGISAIVGISGTVDQAIEAYLTGSLEGGETTCDHY